MEKLRKSLFNDEIDNENSELMCVICNKCLSVPPILYNSVFGNICGRSNCISLSYSKGTMHEQPAYESVAKYLVFPCMYKDNGCKAELNWGQVEQHEEICQHKNFLCPLSDSHFLVAGEVLCDWVGDRSSFLSHMEDEHCSKMFVNNLELSFYRDYSLYKGEIYFTKILEDIVVVMLYSNEFQTAVYFKVWAGFSIFKNLQYQIRIFDKDGINSTALRKHNAQLFSPVFWKGKIDKNWLELDFKYLENFLDKPDIINIEFEFNGLKCGVSNECKSLSINSKDCFLSTDLKEAKCDNCNVELFPPVFMCYFAHNICISCKKTEKCPKCSSSWAKSRNYAYEKLKYILNQPCKNYSKGCLYKGTYPYVKDHETLCSLNPRKCILGCSANVDNLLCHLKHDHPLSISALDLLYNLHQLKLHVFLFDDKIFLFRKNLVTDVGFSFQVSCLEMKEVNYRYKLHLINDKFLGCEIMLSHFCHPEWVDLKKLETDDVKGLTNEILIPHNVLEQMFPDLRNMKFKMNISKIESSGK